MEALETQGEDTGILSVQSANPLAKKLNRIIDARIENDSEMLEALKTLSTFFTENNLRSRRNLRSDIERRNLAINEDFVQTFGQIKNELDSIYENTLKMNASCKAMSDRLQNCKSQTQSLLTKTTKLQKEKERLEICEKVAGAFIETYQLKPAEVAALRGETTDRLGHITLDESFFTALSRVKQIHEDSKILLRTNQQTAGLEIMDGMALQQEAAYERLFRWAQGECRSLTSDSPSISSIMNQAMEKLQDRSVLFKYVLDEYSTARRASVVRCFIDTLTRGSASGMPKPIELHSHDMLRYCGDILAWLHQASASEKELLETLFKTCAPEYVAEHMTPTLSKIMEGVCRPFQIRVEQVVTAELSPIPLYKVANLHLFYHNTIKQVIGEGGALLQAIEDLQTLARKLFANSLNSYTTKLADKADEAIHDLTPTKTVVQSVDLLKDILSSYDSSVAIATTDKQHDFRQIIDSILDPLLNLCTLVASKMAPADMAAYMLNCLIIVKNTLVLYEFTDSHMEMLQAQIEAHLDTLVTEQVSAILTQVQLNNVYVTVQYYQPKMGPVANLPEMDIHSLKQSMVKLDTFLSSPDAYTLPQHSHLMSSSIRQAMWDRSKQAVCTAYKLIHGELSKAQSGYSQPVASFLTRTPDQVRTLLQ